VEPKGLAGTGLCVVGQRKEKCGMQYLLPEILLIVSAVVFLENKGPKEHRPLAFDDPWGPIIYIPLSLLGLYLLLRVSWVHAVLGWLVAIVVASAVEGIKRRLEARDKK